MDTDSTHTVTAGDWSLMYAVEPGTSELYNIHSDPKQEHNIIGEQPEVARELHKMLVSFMRETGVASELAERRAELRL